MCLGRDGEIKNIKENLNEKYPLLLVNGIGGIGKTTLVKEFFNRFKKEYDFYGFIEFNDTIEESFLVGFEKYFESELEYIPHKEKFKKLIFLLSNLEGEKLLVIDNLQKEEEFEKIKDLSSEYHLLLTSRVKFNTIHNVFLEILKEEDAKKLFLAYFNTNKDIDILLKYLGYHTQFIKLTAQSLESSNVLTIDSLEKKFESGEFKTITNNEEDKSFYIYLNELFKENSLNDSEILLLRRISIFPSIDIIFSDLKDFLSIKDEVKFDRELFNLSKSGWLIKSEDSYKMHQIVKEFLFANYKISINDNKDIIYNFINKIDSKKNVKIKDLVKYIPFSISIIDCLSDKVNEKVLLIHNLSQLYRILGKGKEALTYQQKAVKICERVLRKNHPYLAILYSFLSVIFSDLKNFKDALIYQKQAIKIFEEEYDDNIPALITNYNNLSVLYKYFGDFKDALLNQKKVIKIAEEMYDSNNPVLAGCYTTLSSIYKDLENLKDALTYQKKAIEIFEKVYDKNHHDLALNYNNLSTIYQKLRNLKEALAYQKKAIKIFEDIHDKEHPNLATSYQNLSSIYKDLGDTKNSLSYLLKAIKIREKVLTENDTSLASNYYEASLTYQELENFDEALIYQKKEIKICETILNKNHPTLASRYKNFALIYEKLENYELAKDMIIEALRVLPNNQTFLDILERILDKYTSKD